METKEDTMKKVLAQFGERGKVVLQLIDASNQVTMASVANDRVARTLTTVGTIGTIGGGAALVLGTSTLWVKAVFVSGAVALLAGFGKGLVSAHGEIAAMKKLETVVAETAMAALNDIQVTGN